MKKLLAGIFLCAGIQASAQNNLTNNIIEGGKVVVDLLRVIKAPKTNLASQTTAYKADSCSVKALADISYKNTSGKAMYISLYKRNGNIYSPVPLSLKVNNNAQEWLYEIAAGIYKYKIEYDGEEEKRILHSEGELKLSACDRLLKEIKKE